MDEVYDLLDFETDAKLIIREDSVRDPLSRKPSSRILRTRPRLP